MWYITEHASNRIASCYDKMSIMCLCTFRLISLMWQQSISLVLLNESVAILNISCSLVELCNLQYIQDLFPDVLECRYPGLGKEYCGHKSVTKSGKTCQKWSSQSSHKHTRDDPFKFPDSSLTAANNYCRNPDDTPGGPWCYTTESSTRWEFCDIPICPGRLCYPFMLQCPDSNVSWANVGTRVPTLGQWWGKLHGCLSAVSF